MYIAISRGGAMVACHALNVKLLVQVQTPQPLRIGLRYSMSRKGGGEVKNKQPFFFKRFVALVAALVICSSLCVPAFASNNAQWRKWVILDERNLTNEQGTESKYFRLTPYQNGQVYAAVIQSAYGRFRLTFSDGAVDTQNMQSYLACYNYPDWWRSSIPLGAVSYMEIRPTFMGYSSSPFASSWTSASSGSLCVFDSNNRVDVSIHSSPENDGGTVYPSATIQNAVTPDAYLFSASYGGGYTFDVSRVPLTVGQTSIVSISNLRNVVVSWPFSSSSNFSHGSSFAYSFLTNLSSERLVLGCYVGAPYSYMTAEISFWIDANKLPSGLQVGDEFPADTDAFDQLRDELLDQFPEASDNIQNGKDNLTAWNDSETVDTDVASSSISVLNALFQNLGGFLFIISLMVFGAVVLRMFIRKAVNG